MREDDMAVLAGLRHDRIVVGPDVSDPAPMDRLVSGIAEDVFPDVRDIRVQDDRELFRGALDDRPISRAIRDCSPTTINPIVSDSLLCLVSRCECRL